MATLLRLLGEHGTWEEIRVVLDPDGRAGPQFVVTARGPAGAAAAADPRVVSLCRSRSTRLDVDGTLLVVDGTLGKGHDGG